MTDPGRLFMFGVYGHRPSRHTVALFRQTGATGVLLLARNIKTPAQTKAYIDELEQRLGRPLLAAVDHEGGWVLRFSSGVTAFPGNAALGRARDPRLAYAQGRQMARELAPLGIRMNLAPVLDVETDAYNPGIGIRSFGTSTELVGRLGAAFIRGLQEHGVSACAKHFPGKGAATVDAHVDLPTIRLPRAEFARAHLAPFHEAIKAGVDAVMSSHVRFPAYDSVPATFSRKLARDILRRDMGYDGLVVSDDLCMGAITTRWPVAEATLRALESGHDVLMIAHDVQGMRDAVELLRESGAAQEPALAASAARIEKLLSRRRADRKASLTEGLDLAQRIARSAVDIVRRSSLKLPVPLKGTLFLVPDFREVRARFSFENGPLGPEKFLRRLGRGGKFIRSPIESAPPSRWAALADKAERIVFLCFEARRFPGQAATLKWLARRADKTVAVLIRSSRDLDLCPASMTVVDSAGYRLVSLEAALKLILKENE